MTSKATARRSDPHAPAVRARGLSKRFGWTWALRDVELEIARGTSVALVGPNGAGKTTLLRAIATLISPSEGELEVLGWPAPGGGDEIRRRVGLLTASGYLYDDLTAAENLRFAALMCGDRPDRGRILGGLERVGLADAAEVRVRAFSSGMRKRLELARLLLRPLELMLMDEPYASLDAHGIRLVDDVVREARATGTTVVFASHQHGESLRTADRVALLVGGRVQRAGSPEELSGQLGWDVAGPGSLRGGSGAR